jgi:hypothetical protein
MWRVLLVAGLLSAPAHAATITEVGGSAGGKALALSTADFVGSGPCGSGKSVINDGCSVVKKDASSPRPFGRFDPLGGAWVDSQDRNHIVWTVNQDTAFTSLNFALTDAFDQKRDDRYGGKSYFSLSVGNATWTIDKREKNGTLHWLTVLFDAPVNSASLTFETRLNDGWGVSEASVAPIPLPPTALLLLGGVGLMAWMRRRSIA